MCSACEDAEISNELWKSAATKLLGSSFGSVGLALLSFFLNPCFVITFLAVLTAVGALTSLQRHPEYRPHLGWRLPVVIVASVTGILLAAVHVLLIFVGIALS